MCPRLLYIYSVYFLTWLWNEKHQNIIHNPFFHQNIYLQAYMQYDEYLFQFHKINRSLKMIAKWVWYCIFQIVSIQHLVPASYSTLHWMVLTQMYTIHNEIVNIMCVSCFLENNFMWPASFYQSRQNSKWRGYDCDWTDPNQYQPWNFVNSVNVQQRIIFPGSLNIISLPSHQNTFCSHLGYKHIKW